jgi:tetratricopeptide (TPR) repeat protein/pimeloyl-ACP methyl ester carboxylesterase
MRYFGDFDTFERSDDEPLVIHRHGDRSGDALVVFLHGWGGNRYGTWMPPGKEPAPDGFPRFLYEDFPQSDIGLYSYRTMLSRVQFWKAISFEKESRVLADRLRQVAEDYRAIILAGHSAGGVLASSVICELIDRINEQSTLKKIRGIFLFATPQAGSLWALWPLRLLTEYTRVLGPHSRPLRRIQQLFRERVVADQAKLGEGQFVIPIFAVVAAEDLWVDEFSSSLGVPRNRICHVRTSHTGCVKPHTREDDAYKWVCGKIAELLERVPVNLAPISASFDNKPLTDYAVSSSLLRMQRFFGRTAELKRIRTFLTQESSAWGVIVDGPGGRGKTSLAVQAALATPAGQFHRFIFLSAKSREMDDDGERRRIGLILSGVVEISNELARRIDCPQIVECPENSKLPRLLDALAGQKALLIFDNLESLSQPDRDQVLSFVRQLPKDCKAILTSRDPMGVASERMSLEVLDRTTAFQIVMDLAANNSLLARITRRERAALYEETAGNALLLRWVAGQLGRGNCRTIAHALDFLSSCPMENDPLEFIFGDLVQEFDNSETAILGALSCFQLPARVDHLAAVTGLSVAIAEPTLRSLVNRALVIPNTDETSYEITPMVAAFFRKRQPSIIVQTVKRLQRLAFETLEKNGGRNYSRFHIIEETWPVVGAALAPFSDGSNEELQSVCSNIYAFLNFSGRWDELQKLNERAERKAESAGDHESAGFRAYQLGLIHYRRHDVPMAIACSFRAEAHWRNVPEFVIGACLPSHLRGLAYRTEGNYDLSIAELDKAILQTPTQYAESREMAIFMADRGDTKRLAGALSEAEADLREGLRIALTAGDDQVTLGTMIRLTQALIAQGDFKNAETFAHEALSLSAKVGRQEFVADCCLNLAKVLVGQGLNSSGANYARQAVEIYDRIGSPKHKEAVATLSVCQN